MNGHLLTKTLFGLQLAVFLSFSPVLQAAPAVVSAEESMEVTAEESLEWYQDTRLYVARGAAKAVRGETTIMADILTAHAREEEKTEGSKKKDEKAFQAGGIDRVTAEGNVSIHSGSSEVWGDKAVYDFDQKVAQITGDKLRYKTDKYVVTARDSFDYYEEKGIAVARGKALAVQEGRQIEADTLTAHFVRLPSGKTEITEMTGDGNVVVKMKEDIVRGEHAVYDVRRNGAVISGKVRITRADTQMEGEVADVDFTKGESRLLSGGKGPVRVLLMPKASKGGKADKR